MVHENYINYIRVSKESVFVVSLPRRECANCRKEIKNGELAFILAVQDKETKVKALFDFHEINSNSIILCDYIWTCSDDCHNIAIKEFNDEAS